MKAIKSICPYCGVGCGIVAQVEDGRLLKIVGDTDHPTNLGRLCTKGTTLLPIVETEERLLFAHLREDRSKELCAKPLEGVLGWVADRIEKTVREHGPDSVAFYISGQLTTEAQYVANKLCKGFIRTNNIDSNSRLCMASAALGYKLSLGADAPPGSYSDIEHSDSFLIAGSNMADCHPILFSRVLERMEDSGASLIVIDPRRTETARKATLHLPIRPGTDLALFNGILNLLVAWKAIDTDFVSRHTEGWESARELVQEYPPETVSPITGLSIDRIEQAARLIADAENWMSFWTMGLNQSTKGTWNTNALINLHLATGAIGKPGAGPFSLTGQPNAMGGREVGYMSGGLPGQRSVSNREDRAFIESLWDLEEGSIDSTPGCDAVSLFQAIKKGDIRLVWIIGTNPVASFPNRREVIEALEKAETVIVQDTYHPTETTHYADALLPAAAWIESEGTMVNSERRLLRLGQAVNPKGEASSDWELICGVARKLGHELAFNYLSAADVFEEIRATSNPETGYDLRGITFDRLAEKTMQWPCPDPDSDGSERRYGSSKNSASLQFPTPTGKARFWARPYAPPEETPDKEYPFALTTGRVPHQWHTRTRTGKAPSLNKLNPGPFLEINERDAGELGVARGQSIRLSSRRGTAVLPALVTADIAPGTCFAPIHWNDSYGEECAINEITNDAVDPLSLQPELKYCAVKLTPVANEEEGSPSALDSAPLHQTEIEGPSVQDRLLSTAETFSTEQKQYLEGFMSGVGARGVAKPTQLSTHNGSGASEIQSEEEEEVYGTPVSALAKEEKIKLQENALDIRPRMEENAREGVYPEGPDVFRYKFHGLFYVNPAQDSFMIRLRIPGCVLNTHQLRGIADIAEQWGGGYATITTRGNIQIREIQAPDAVHVLDAVLEIGLSSRGSGADNIRNVTASPTSGFDPNETYDVLPLAKSLHHHILNRRDLYGLPRKFNVAFDSGGAVTVMGDTNDIGFQAVRIGEGRSVSPGVYFRVQLGGITGHGTFARDCGLLIEPDRSVAVAVAMIQVFIENGNRTNRKRARLKYLLEKWGFERFLEETEKKLPFPLQRFPLEDCESRLPKTRHGHLGIHPEKEPGKNYVGVSIPVGVMQTDRIRQLSDIADDCGAGEIRLTVMQNSIVPHVPDEKIEEIKKRLVDIGFHYRASTLAGGLVACTGNAGCQYSATDTKGQATHIAKYLEEKISLDFPINIHLTGCPHSCAQHYCGDIGLLGTTVEREGESVEGYDIVLGGGCDQDQGLARPIFSGVGFEDVPSLLEQVLLGYTSNRNGNESFVEFTRRHEIEDLKNLWKEKQVG